MHSVVRSPFKAFQFFVCSSKYTTRFSIISVKYFSTDCIRVALWSWWGERDCIVYLRWLCLSLSFQPSVSTPASSQTVSAIPSVPAASRLGFLTLIQSVPAASARLLRLASFRRPTFRLKDLGPRQLGLFGACNDPYTVHTTTQWWANVLFNCRDMTWRCS
jgi:hypothetical protein